MNLKKKLWIVALAGVLPWAGAHAQSVADLQKEIQALRAQLQTLQQKVEAISAQPEATPLAQQVNRLEQRLDLGEDDTEKSGFKGLKINGVIEATYKRNNIDASHEFAAGAGYGAGEFGMIQITKESQDGEGVDWTLRLLPGGDPLVQEASLSIPLNKNSRIIAGLIPDFQGYEYIFPNANPTLGNQLITHNALYDLAGATAYTGVGMAYSLGGGKYAFKWVVGNADGPSDVGATWDPDPKERTGFLRAKMVSDADGNLVQLDAKDAVESDQAFPSNSTKKSTIFAYRGDWYVNDTTYVGLSGLHGSGGRTFGVMALDGGITRGDWQVNGQLSIGRMDRAGANGSGTSWQGVSGLVGYKIVPRLQLLARADYLMNSENGGGTYFDNGGWGFGCPTDCKSNGLGPKRDANGVFEVDDNGYATTGANLVRLTVGTNYQVNSTTQWKTEFRLDQSSGYNFVNTDGTFTKEKQSMGTSLLLSF
jgi:hypothetical protein